MRKIAKQAVLLVFYLAMDIACIFLSVFLAYCTYHALDLGKTVNYDLYFLMSFALFLTAIVCLVMYKCGAYYRDSGLLNVREVRSVIMGIFFSLLIINAFFYAVRFMPSRYFVFLCFGYMFLLLPMARSTVYSYLTNKLPGIAMSRALIYGAGELGQRLFREIHNSPRMHTKAIGFIDDNPQKMGLCVSPCGFHTENNCRVLGNHKDIPFLIHNHHIDTILIAISKIDNGKLKALYEICRKNPVNVAFVPHLLDIFTHRLSLEHIGNLPLVWEQENPPMPYHDIVKRVMDLGLCLIMAPLLLPVMAVISLAVKIDSKGPVFFTQQRVGKDGKIFNIYKFRSMVQDAPKYAVNPDSNHDPRITRVGRLLRKTSLDELPQLINVLKGEMSLVGPRPEMPFIVEQYSDRDRERLKVLPGITGLWQLSGDRKKAIHENLDYDLYYIYNRSFFLDTTILIQTFLFAFKGI